MPGSSLLGQMLALLIIHQSTRVQSLIYGTPKENCRSMLPQHDNFLPQMGQAPYNFSVSKIQNSSSASSNIFNVSLTALQRATFKGFFIQARTSDRSDAIIGSFNPEKSDVFQFIDCTGGKNNAATHVFNNLKRHVSFTWSPPVNFEGQFYFVSTVVAEYRVYWLGLETPNFNITKTSGFPSNKNDGFHYENDKSFN